MDRTKISDFQPALDSVDALCEKYQAKGKDTWKLLSALEHLHHATAHLDSILASIREVPMDVFNFEDFQSLAFRSLAALHQAIQAQKDTEHFFQELRGEKDV